MATYLLAVNAFKMMHLARRQFESLSLFDFIFMHCSVF